MATYNFLDYNGLKNLLTKINNYYASKVALTQLDTELRDKILQDLTAEDTQLKNLITQTQTALEDSLSSEQTSRENADQALTESVNSLSAALNTAVQTLNTVIEQAVTTERQARIAADNSLTEVDQAFTTSLAQEISARATKDTALENQITDLSNDVDTRLSDLSGTLSATLKNYIDQKIADLDFEGVKDIIIIPEGESLPETGVDSYLYITSDHAIHQWVGISEDYPEGWKTLGEDSTAEITALTGRVTAIEGQITDVNDRLDYTVDTETYEEFINSYTEKVEEIDQAIAEADQAITEVSQSVDGIDQIVTEITQAVTGLETEVASKISGITVNDEPVEIEDGIAHITVSGGGGGEGTDPELRAEFEAFKELAEGQITTLSTAMATKDALEEHTSAENPHNITKETLGLDKVLNYSPLEILAPAMEILETKVDTEALEEALAEKVSFTDIIDDLVTPETAKPLSANQGIILDEKIETVNNRITSLGAALVFKGTVDAYENLPANADDGDCYQIYSDNQDPHHGEVYAKISTGWTQIVASAQDMSSLVASPADVNKIISDFS